jgi:membrane dipeptidase
MKTHNVENQKSGRLLGSHLVWDNHACLPMRPDDETFLPQLEQYRSAGVDVVSLNIGYGSLDLEHHLRMAAVFRRWIHAHGNRFQLIDSVKDIDAAREAGRLAITFDVEGMAPLDRGDHGLVELLYDVGVRWMLVAYNRNNAAGGGCHDDDQGLTAYGRALLAEMKRVGMVVCCSHTGHRTVRDVFEHAGNPVIFSHSNPLAIARHQRNIPDDLILGCAATGGVVGINGIGFFLGTNERQAQTFADAVDYVVQLTGPDHVGLGLDYVFDQEELARELAANRHTWPDPEAYAGELRMLGPADLPAIVDALASRGYADADLAKILGGNWRRIAEQVWAPGNAPALAKVA